jgi:predicted TIM-barrel fold metal-dependent hydrolase
MLRSSVRPGVVAGLPDQLPIAQAAPIAREYNEQLAKAPAKYPGRFYGTANIPLNETKQAIAMVDETVKESRPGRITKCARVTSRVILP